MSRSPLLIGLLLIGVLAAWWWWPTDEAKVRAVLEKVGDALTIDGTAGPLADIAELTALRQLLTEDVEIDAGRPFGTLTGRDQIFAAAGRFRGTVQALELQFKDVTVMFDDGHTTAQVSATAEARYERTGGAGREVDAREIELGFVHEADDEWRLRSARAVATIQGPPMALSFGDAAAR